MTSYNNKCLCSTYQETANLRSERTLPYPNSDGEREKLIVNCAIPAIGVRGFPDSIASSIVTA